MDLERYLNAKEIIKIKLIEELFYILYFQVQSSELFCPFARLHCDIFFIQINKKV